MLCVCECEKNLIFINAEIASVNSIDKKKTVVLFFRCYKDAVYINLVVVQSQTRETPVQQ
jgi:hypothetical protein